MVWSLLCYVFSLCDVLVVLLGACFGFIRLYGCGLYALHGLMLGS